MPHCNVQDCGNYAIDTIQVTEGKLTFKVRICSYHLMSLEHENI